MNIIKYLKRIWCKEETNYTPKSPDPELTLKVIKRAKENFKYHKYNKFMCPNMVKAYYVEVKEEASIYKVRKLIPEFNPEFLGGEDSLFWWHPTDKKSRIKAFDKLIKIYSKKP